VFEIFFVIGIQSIFGVITRSINRNKGYDGGFAWGFFLGIVGIIVVAIRPFNQNRWRESEDDE
jgi:hypothetical protein